MHVRRAIPNRTTGTTVAARCARNGVTILEIILMAPVILVFLAAVIEFGLIFANLKYLPLASRAGAKAAAETAVGTLNSAATLTSITNSVNGVLAAGGMTACRVIFEENVTGGGTLQAGTCTCTAPTITLPTDGDGAVRVTVCVEVSQMTNDFLSSFGFSVSGRIAEASTVLPYENP